MLYGKGQPKLILLNADGTQNLVRTFDFADRIQPKFKDETIEYTVQDGQLIRYIIGWWVEFDIYWPSISDAEFADLITMMKDQGDIDSELGTTKYIEMTPRVDNAAEKYEGFIVSPIEVLNEFYFLTHGARITFKSKKRLRKDQFLL